MVQFSYNSHMPIKPQPYRPRHRPARAPDLRGSSTARGYGTNHRKLRLMHLRNHPLCIVCGGPATEMDHKDGNVYNLAEDNLQSYCKPHHSEKTAREQGVFGRGATNA